MMITVMLSLLLLAVEGTLWCSHGGKYLREYSSGTYRFAKLEEAQRACLGKSDCSGITFETGSGTSWKYTLRRGSSLGNSPSDEISFKTCQSSSVQHWCAYGRQYLGGYTSGTSRYANLADAQRACTSKSDCGGITFETKSGHAWKYTLRKSTGLATSSSDEISFKTCKGSPWCSYGKQYLGGYSSGTYRYAYLQEAKDHCKAKSDCSGITFETGSGTSWKYTLRRGSSLGNSQSDEISFMMCDSDANWCAHGAKYLSGYSSGTSRYQHLNEALMECTAKGDCGGVTFETKAISASNRYTLRKGTTLHNSASDDVSFTMCDGPEKCRLTKMEILDMDAITGTYEGTQIIGIATGGTCIGTSVHTLSLESVDSVQESIGLELSETNEVNWSISASVEVEVAAKIFGSGSSVTVGLEVGRGGSHSYTRTETKAFSKENSNSVGHETTYKSPGAALLIGQVDRYKIDKSNIPVKMHFQCPSGRSYTKDSTLRLTSTSYQAAHFEGMVGEFSKEACDVDSSLPDCTRFLPYDYSDFFGNMAVVRDAFKACFTSDKGAISSHLKDIGTLI